MFRVVYSDKVVAEDIPALTKTIKDRIRLTIEQKLASKPIDFGKPLSHSWRGHRSLRIGDYRVLYRVDGIDMVVYIVTIGHRSAIYDQ
jgi:mRNA interferase RelE/StbE